ncbi:MAG: hypothetical protein IT280_07515 [Ignavibacteria bacterium]|nr:hypothetical protein [Ignavibacteria bacterium]
MRKIYFHILFLLAMGLSIISCNKPGETPQSGGESGSSNRRIEIIDIIPKTLPSVTRDSFDVTLKGHNIYQGVYVHVEVKSHGGSSCTGFSDSIFITREQSSNTIKIRTDSITSGCVSQNSVFRIIAWFTDTLNIPRRDSVYYQWGNAPTTGNTLTADIEPWRMYYVSDTLADTLNKCIERSLNPSDSNFIKCTATFDAINHQSPDTNFMVGSNNTEGLTIMCNWWSQNHSIDPFKNKVIYAKLNDVNIGLVGWAQTSNYPPNGTGNWSYIFYKNIVDLCPPNGTRNDTTIGNMTAIHEIMHQLANSHGDRAHIYHYGYFEKKCVLRDEEEPFELSNHRYINRFRVCINHTMQLRSFRQVLPLDNTYGNVIYTQFVAPDPFLKAGGNSNGDKYIVSISIPKQEYKKYEPVVAKLKLVNNGTKPLDIYNVFNELSSEPHFTIKDSFGHVYDSRNRTGLFLSYYTTELPPRDSLVFSMTMNNWGKATSYEYTNSLDEVYFSQFGYFPPGDYKAYFHCSPLRNDEEIFSNEVAFSVTDLTQEDTEILKLYKQKNYDEALAKFPNNAFSEHMLRWKMLSHWNEISSNTESDYNNFIQKYPNSMYLYDWAFMLPYLKAAEQNQDNFDRGIDYLLSIQNEESAAKQSLLSTPFTTIIKNYGKFIQKNK